MLLSLNNWAIASAFSVLGTLCLVAPASWRLRQQTIICNLYGFGAVLWVCGVGHLLNDPVIQVIAIGVSWAEALVLWRSRRSIRQFFETNALNNLIIESENLNPFLVMQIEGDDLRILYANDNALKSVPALQVGQALGELVPAHREKQGYNSDPLLDTYRQVAIDGETWTGEAVIKDSNLEGIFRIAATQIGRDRVFVTWLDISEERDFSGGQSDLLEAQQALLQRKFILHYQPIFALEELTLHGYEALIRWRLPDGSLKPPADFLPLLDKAGLTPAVFFYVLEEVLKVLPYLDPDLKVAINTDLATLKDEQFPGRMLAMCSLGQLNRLGLEITENYALEIPLIPKLQQVKDQGSQLSVDDFGTGYARYATLIGMKGLFDFLKIDRTFIRDVHQDPDKQDVVRSILALAKALGFQSVAEGIQSLEELNWLKEAGCDFGQGFLLGEPKELNFDDINLSPMTSKFSSR